MDLKELFKVVVLSRSIQQDADGAAFLFSALKRSNMIRSLMILGIILTLSVPSVLGAGIITTKSELIIGGDHACPPYEFLESEKPTGFNVELIPAVADIMGFDTEFRLGPWINVRQDLEQGRIDALAEMYYSANRSRLVDFSIPHTLVTSGISVRKSSSIRSFADIQDKEIIVQEGNIIHDALQRNGLASRIVNGKYREIYEKWFGVYQRRGLWESMKNHLFVVSVVIAVLFAAGCIWFWSLRKQVRIRTAELRESEEKFRVLAETTPAAIIVYQEDRFVYLNPAATQATGYSEQECMGMKFWDLAHDDFKNLARDRGMARQRGEETPSRYEYKWVAKSGEERWAFVSGARIEYRGKPAGIVSLIDITERKRMEDELKQAHFELEKRVEERTAELRNANEQLEREITVRKQAEEALLLSRFCIDKAGIGIFQCDESGAIFNVNDHVCKSLGYSREELSALSVFDIDSEITRERMLELRGILAEKGAVSHHTTHKRRDGSTFPVEITCNSLQFREREYVISFAQDITERKRAEEALRDSETRLKMAMNIARLVQWEYDVESGMFTFEDQFYALYGTTVEREGGILMSAEDYVRKFLPLEETEVVAGGLAEVLANSSNQMEHRIIRADGEERVIVVRGETMRDEAGRIAKIRGANQDITERKRMEELLRKSEAAQRNMASQLAQKNNFLRTLIDAIPDLIFFKDCNRAYLGCNRAFEAFAGRPEKDLIGRTDLDIFSRDIALSFREMDLEILSTEESRRNEEWGSYPDGRRVLLETLKTPFFDLDGEILGVVGVSRDITDRKRLEEELLLSHFCINEAAIGIVQVSLDDGKILRVNDYVCRSLGYSSDELRATTIFDIDPSLSKEKFADLKRIAGLTGSVTFETSPRRKDGTAFPVEVSANILEFQGVSTAFTFFRDITERKQAEEALRESESRVKRKLESILDPEGDTGVLDLADILDTSQIQKLMDDLYRITGLKMSIIDLKGQVLTKVGWQAICTQFHRNHPETLRKCLESDSDHAVGIPQGEFKTYRCKNNMWHLVTPIVVGGKHMGNLFMGQFFFADDKIDYDLFRSQARTYVFPEAEYIAALDAVPRHSEELVNMGKAVFLRLTDMFSKLSYANIKLAHSLAEQDRLTATLRKANLVVENSPAVLFRWKGNDEWQVELVSENIKQFGYTPDDFLSGGTTYSSIIHPHDRERITREVHDFCDGGADQFRLEYRIVTKGKDVRWINEHTHVERDAAGVVLNFEGIVIDVTERKRAEDSIRVSRAKYQAIVDSFDGLIYICSQDYRIEFMNRKLIERTGREAIGEFCYQVLHDRDSVCPWCVTPRVLAGETVHWEIFSPKDGRWYHVVNVPIFNANGTVSKHSVVSDIHDLKQSEEKLREQKLLLEELNDTLEKRVGEEVAKNREKDIMLIQQNRQAAMGDLLDHIAHQWKQPLTVVSLLIQNLWASYTCSGLTIEKIGETFGKTTDLLEHMAQTIEVFRDFYRPDKEKTVFRISDSVENALAFILPALNYQSVAVELDVDPELLAMGYPREYVQVLLNVLSNARDALIERKTEKPKILIRGMAEENRAVVTITDNAGGIPESMVASIFDLYVTTKEASGGTGIGLHMSKNIIEKNMDGSLTAHNTDFGAQFRIAVNMPPEYR